MDLFDELKKLIARLTEEKIEYALCGGLAMAVYALPRATLDKVEWESGALSVVSPEGLILLKSFRMSGQDQDDIRYLRSITDED